MRTIYGILSKYNSVFDISERKLLDSLKICIRRFDSYEKDFLDKYAIRITSVSYMAGSDTIMYTVNKIDRITGEETWWENYNTKLLSYILIDDEDLTIDEILMLETKFEDEYTDRHHNRLEAYELNTGLSEDVRLWLRLQ